MKQEIVEGFENFTPGATFEQEDPDQLFIDKETEQEVIKQLRMQNKIISDYEEQVVDLNLRLSQLDVYKQQVANLQSQLQVLGEKFKLTEFDADNAKIAEQEIRINNFIQNERRMDNEIESKDQEIKFLSERIEEKNTTIRELKKKIEEKDEM